jgi:VanZ family protein
MKINPAHLLLIFRCTFVLALSAITYASLVNVTELPDMTLLVWDKFQHAAAFLLLSFLLQRSFPASRPFSRIHIAQLVFLLGYGILIEYLQSYTPYREASIGDVVADITGISCYTLFYFKNSSGQPAPQGG